MTEANWRSLPEIKKQRVEYYPYLVPKETHIDTPPTNIQVLTSTSSFVNFLLVWILEPSSGIYS